MIEMQQTMTEIVMMMDLLQLKIVMTAILYWEVILVTVMVTVLKMILIVMTEM